MTLPLAYGSQGGGGAGAGVPDFISIEHNSATQDITLSTSNANYEWTEVGEESDGTMFTLTATDEVIFNEAGTYKIEWKLLFAGSGGTPAPYWATSFLELDPLGVGSFAYVPTSLTAATCSDDPTGGQSKITHLGMVVITVAATDELRVRTRRGALAATTVTTDGGNGSTLVITKVA